MCYMKVVLDMRILSVLTELERCYMEDISLRRSKWTLVSFSLGDKFRNDTVRPPVCSFSIKL